MIVQFEAQDGTVLERSEESKVVANALPRVIQGQEGSYWYVGPRIDRELGWLPAYMLAREVSSAVH